MAHQPGPGLLQPRRNLSIPLRRTKLPHAPLVACAGRPSGLPSGRDATSHSATPRRAVAFSSIRDDGCKTHQSPGPSDVVVEHPKPLWLHLASNAFRYLGLLIVVASLIVSSPGEALAKGGRGHGRGGRSGGHVGGRSFGSSSGGSGSGRSGGSISISSSRGGGHTGGGSSPSSGPSYGGGGSSSWSGGGGRGLSASGSAVSASSSAAAATRATIISPSSTRPGGASATTPSTSTPLTTTKSTGGVVGGRLFASSSSSSSNHSNDNSSSTGSAAGRGGGMSAGPGASAYAESHDAPLLYGSGDSNGLSRQGAPGRQPARVFGTSSNSSSSSSNNNNNNSSNVIVNTTNVYVYGGVSDSGSGYPSGIASPAKTAFDNTNTDTIKTRADANGAVVTAVGQAIATPAADTADTLDPSTAQAAADSVPDAAILATNLFLAYLLLLRLFRLLYLLQ